MSDDPAVSTTLFLVATPIGNLGDITIRASELLATVEVVACEDTRRTGRLLQHLGARPRRLILANEHNEAKAAAQIIAELDGGVDVALVSDAGLPGVSDPGERVVAAVIEAGHRVSVLPGASAPAAALVVSGLSSARYVMEGFLPRKGSERTMAIAALVTEQRTTLIFESPRRLGASLADLAAACGPERRAVVVRELTKLHEEIARGTLGELVERFATPPKGEIVVVLEGARPGEVDDATIVGRLVEVLSHGVTKRDAVDQIAAELAVPRNRVYELSIKQS
jgi:16S rRNA (cytidine1402-2'-O)-methyltransferase